MSHRIEVPTKEELISKYSNVGSTISSLAVEYDTSSPTVRKWLIGYGITRKSHKIASQEANLRTRSIIPEKEELIDDYNKLSIKKLEYKYKVGQETIYYWLRCLDIPIIPHIEACGKRNYKFHKRSILEKEIQNFCEISSPEGEWEITNRKLLAPQEIDIVSHKHKIAIEVCGVYWHSEGFGKKTSQYHKEKMLGCRELGYQLITVFDSDPIDYIFGILSYKLRINQTKIFARKCSIKELTNEEATKFHDSYHAARSCQGGSFHIGLYNNEQLLQVLSFSKSRFSSAHEWEMLRFTNQPNIVVIGGLSKLWKYFVTKLNPNTVVTYANLRFGDGSGYMHLGFRLSHRSAPNYWYFYKSNSKKLFSRVMFQKHKLRDKLTIFDPNKTEWENMQLNGYDRIWDCGNMVYEWRK